MSNLHFENDGAYENLVTGMGTEAADKDMHTRVIIGEQILDYEALASQYVKDGLTRRLAEEPVNKALKNPIIINGDDGDKTYKALSKKGFFRVVRKVGTWTRLFGGALVVTVYDSDGVNVKQLKQAPPKEAKVAGWRIYSPAKVSFTTDLYDSKIIGGFRGYNVQFANGSINEIHHSRCTIFKGPDIPDVLECGNAATMIFGASEVEMANAGLLKIPSAYTALSNMMQETGVGTLSMAGLTSTLADPNGGIDKVRKRLQLMKLSMSSLRMMLLDKEDAYANTNHQTSELPESVKSLMAYVSALTGIPVSILFGNMVSGLSSTNEGDIRQFESMVEEWRNAHLYEPMVRLITDYINRNEGIAGEHDFQFGDISQPTAHEKAQLKNELGNFVKTLYDMGAITPQEARENLIVNGGTTEISVSSKKAPPKTEEKQEL